MKKVLLSLGLLSSLVIKSGDLILNNKTGKTVKIDGHWGQGIAPWGKEEVYHNEELESGSKVVIPTEKLGGCFTIDWKNAFRPEAGEYNIITTGSSRRDRKFELQPVGNSKELVRIDDAWNSCISPS